MKSTESAVQQATALTRHFKTHASHLRIDTLQRLIDVLLAMIAARSVNHHDLSAHMPGRFWQLNLSEAGVAQQVA
ncbi:hypothetical protein [Deinococcus sp. PESE-13]